MEENDKMDEAIDRLHKNKNPVLMYKDSVPKPTLSAFWKLADAEFGGNYAFTLKYLIDFHNGIINALSPELEAKIGMMDARLEMLEKSFTSDKPKEVPKEKEKFVTSADGTRLKVDA